MKLKPLPQPSFTVTRPDRHWEQAWSDYMQGVDTMLTPIAVAAPSNATAAAAGVPLGGFYTDGADPAHIYIRTV
jgi:hypothetical protein